MHFPTLSPNSTKGKGGAEVIYPSLLLAKKAIFLNKHSISHHHKRTVTQLKQNSMGEDSQKTTSKAVKLALFFSALCLGQLTPGKPPTHQLIAMKRTAFFISRSATLLAGKYMPSSVILTSSES